MGLTKRVHFLMDPGQFAAMKALTRSQPRPTGERLTVGSLFREAVTEYLAKHQKPTESRSRRRPSR